MTSAPPNLVLRGGTIVDGRGGAPFEGDVAVAGGRIIGVGAVGERGAEELDARGRLVRPGFVDVHTHYDGQVTWAERLLPSSGHGDDRGDRQLWRRLRAVPPPGPRPARAGHGRRGGHPGARPEPHLERTYGHTQKTLHELFDDQPPDVTQRITIGAFKDLFPHVSDPPAE